MDIVTPRHIWNLLLVTQMINGKVVLEYSKPQIGGGVANRYDPKIKIDGKMLKSGFIALQSEGQEIDFRKIELLDMSIGERD